MFDIKMLVRGLPVGRRHPVSRSLSVSCHHITKDGIVAALDLVSVGSPEESVCGRRTRAAAPAARHEYLCQKLWDCLQSRGWSAKATQLDLVTLHRAHIGNLLVARFTSCVDDMTLGKLLVLRDCQLRPYSLTNHALSMSAEDVHQQAMTFLSASDDEGGGEALMPSTILQRSRDDGAISYREHISQIALSRIKREYISTSDFSSKHSSLLPTSEFISQQNLIET